MSGCHGRQWICGSKLYRYWERCPCGTDESRLLT